jgi:benzoylformate decarboxylase
VLAALADRIPREAIVLEEAPVDRPDIHARLPAREPLGYLSAAQGGLGFAMPAAVGLRMALPHRPVVAVVGDGSALYGVHSTWSAVQYGVAPLWVVLSNGGYVVMDRLAEKHDRGDGPWPAFGDVELATIARGFGCPSQRITTHDELVAAFDDAVPTLASRTEPLLLDVEVAPTATFMP